MNKGFPDTELIAYNGWRMGNDETLLISKTIGYMLKVIKSGKDIKKYRTHFNAIKHGDYDQFFALMEQPGAELLIQGTAKSDGFNTKSDNFSQESGDCDVTMIINVNNGLRKFYPNCFNEYGYMQDVHFTDIVFNRCAAFELAIRVHNNNLRSKLNISYNKQDTFNLKNIIDELCEHANIPLNENQILQRGRDFVNWIKHCNEPKFKVKFTSWKEGIDAFRLAWDLCGKHCIKIHS